jgi:hypothetical protein
MPNDDAGKVVLMEHVHATLPKYTDVLEISPADMDTLKTDTGNMRYTYNMQQRAQSFAHNWTAFKNLIRDGGSGSTEWPVPPELDKDISPILAAGIIPRFSTLVASIKAHKNYTAAIGQDLRIIGSEITIDSASWKPVLNVKIKAGHPVIIWTKGHASAIEIWVDRGEGFVFFTINTEPDTPDNTALPSPPTQWKYKAIYRLHDEQVGGWSDVMSILAGG